MKESGKVNYGLVLGVIAVVIAIVGVAAFVMQSGGPGTTTTVTTTMPTTTTPTTKNLIFQTDWMTAGSHLDFFVAQDMFWPQRGLNVQIVRGVGSEDTARKLGLGAIDFGISAFDAAAVVKVNEAQNIKCVFSAILRNDAGIGWVANRDAGRGIIDPNDLTTLQGKIYGTAQGEIPYLQLPRFLQNIGLTVDDVEAMFIDPAAVLPGLVRGDFDFAGYSVGEAGTTDAALETAGLTGGYAWYDDYGVEAIGDSIWATDRMINDDPTTVRNFVEGIQEAHVWVMSHVEEAANIMADKITSWKGMEAQLVEEWTTRFQWGERPEVDSTYGVGYLPPERVETALGVIYEMYNIDPEMELTSPTEIYTNEFINATIYPTSYAW